MKLKSVISRNSLLVLLASLSVYSQIYTKKINYVSVEQKGMVLPFGFYGGSYVSKIDWADIDADGDFDLFVVQVDGRITFIENQGTPSESELVWATDYFDSLNVNQWAKFADLDSDGDLDIVCGEPGSTVGIYQNIGSATQAKFRQQTAMLLDSAGASVISEDQSIGVLSDIDGDGDLDFFSGRSVGTLSYYQNIGSATQYRLKFITDSYQNISIVTPAKMRAYRDGKHGASSVTYFDLDHDQDLDLFWGDFFSTGIYYLPNLGTKFNAHIPDTLTSHFPDRSLSTLGYNMPSFVDLDHDADAELFVSVLFRESDYDNLWYYKNTGSVSAPIFSLQTKNYLQGLDVGRNAIPSFSDIDFDGDRDMVVGSYSGKMVLYRYTPASRKFSLDTNFRMNIPEGTFQTAPVFADLDADGDDDLLVGDFTGKLMYFENKGTKQVPDFILQPTNLSGVDIGNNSVPAFADIDHDGDLDLFIGEEDGTTNFFKNVGNASQFVPASIVTNYFGVLGENNASPEFVDYDKDGDLDFFVGYKSGRISFYENIGTPTVPSWVLISGQFKGIKVTQDASPRFYDVDSDGDLDLFSGNLRGGIEFFHAQSQTPVFATVGPITIRKDSLWVFNLPIEGSLPLKYRLLNLFKGMEIDSTSGRITWRPSELGLFSIRATAENSFGGDTISFVVDVRPPFSKHFILFQNAPNPFDELTKIRFELEMASDVELCLYNILGEEVRNLIDGPLGAGTHQAMWDGQDSRGKAVSSGVYFYRLRVGSSAQTRKMIFLK